MVFPLNFCFNPGLVPSRASDLKLYDIFAPQKLPLSKISDDVIACEL